MTDAAHYQAFIPFYPAHDLTATRDFYVRELGLEPESEEGGRLVLRAAGGYLGFLHFDGPLPHHEALTLALLTNDVDGVYQRLRRLGAETELPPRRDDRYRVYHFVARDPDGYRVEIRQSS